MPLSNKYIGSPASMAGLPLFAADSAFHADHPEGA